MESYKEFDDFYQYFKSKMPCFDDFRGINDRFLRPIPSYNFTALQEYIEQNEELEDVLSCKHNFMPIDSTKTVLSCTKCGYVIKNTKMKFNSSDKNPFRFT